LVPTEDSAALSLGSVALEPSRGFLAVLCDLADLFDILQVEWIEQAGEKKWRTHCLNRNSSFGLRAEISNFRRPSQKNQTFGVKARKNQTFGVQARKYQTFGVESRKYAFG